MRWGRGGALWNAGRAEEGAPGCWMALRPIPSITLHLSPSSFSLTDLEKGIKGLIVMSTSLEEIFQICILMPMSSRSGER